MLYERMKLQVTLCSPLLCRPTPWSWLLAGLSGGVRMAAFQRHPSGHDMDQRLQQKLYKHKSQWGPFSFSMGMNVD